MRKPSTKKLIAGLICFARENANIPRKQLAATLDISYQNLWDIENGYKNITCEYLDTIIGKLNYTVDSFWALMPLYLNSLQQQAANQKN